MADAAGVTGTHWVSEVFRPKFEFETVDDLLGKSEEDAGLASPRKDVREVYDRVYCQTISAEKELKSVVHEQASTSSELKEDGVTRTDTTSYQEAKVVEDDEGCLWNEDELTLLRKFFQRAKLQNIKLTAMLDSAQNETKKWKQKYAAVQESVALVKETFGTLRKKYDRLKINYRALKEDLKSYHSNLKIARKDLKELRMEKSSMVKELNATKAELSMVKFKKEEMESSIQQRELEFDKVITKREFTLQQEHLLEMATLKKDMEVLKKAFEQERQENILNKIALEHLRKHFANLQIGETGASSRVFSVIDIDCIDPSNRPVTSCSSQ